MINLKEYSQIIQDIIGQYDHIENDNMKIGAMAETIKQLREMHVKDNKIIKDDYFFLSLDDKGIIGDECRDNLTKNGDSDCDGICQAGETCVRP